MIDGQDERAWRRSAACHGQGDLFFSFDPVDQRAAKRVCLTQCPVRVDCLTWALRNRERDGVWGGLTEAERMKIPASSSCPSTPSSTLAPSST